MPAMPTARRQLAPYRGNARQRIQHVNTVPFVAGQRVSIELPRVGFLAGIHIQFASGLLGAVVGAPTYNEMAYNILRRISVNLNIGSALIYDTSGYGNNLLNQAMSFNYAGDLGGMGVAAAPFPLDATADPNVFQLPAAIAVAPAVGLVFSYWVPIALNDGLNFNIGEINLQAPEIRCTLDLQFGDLTDIFTGAVPAGVVFADASSVVIHYLYYEVPNPDYVQLPPYITHRVLEDRQGIYANGDQLYTMPRQGTLLRAIHNLIIDGHTNTSACDQLKVRVNKTDEVYRMSQSVNRWFSRMRYGHKVPRGAFYHDFWRAADVNAMGDYRDAIDTEAISTLEFTLSTNPATVLGVGNNFIDTIREFTQKLTN